MQRVGEGAQRSAPAECRPIRRGRRVAPRNHRQSRPAIAVPMRSLRSLCPPRPRRLRPIAPCDRCVRNAPCDRDAGQFPLDDRQPGTADATHLPRRVHPRNGRPTGGIAPGAPGDPAGRRASGSPARPPDRSAARTPTRPQGRRPARPGPDRRSPLRRTRPVPPSPTPDVPIPRPVRPSSRSGRGSGGAPGPSRIRRPRRSSDPAPRSERTPRNQLLGRAASYTPLTVAPLRAKPDATDSRNGPVPATTTRLPARTAWPFKRDWTPPAVITPGRSQPGNGTWRS